ncbi:RNA polymerase sigma factor [Kitasatospora sp. NPDC096147]|uniref:RNA polymerase sigma factor n=1 Tax=Kitasatospora sp. NPDC096147 TaxID=3364093 RepID=UPI00381E4141
MSHEVTDGGGSPPAADGVRHALDLHGPGLSALERDLVLEGGGEAEDVSERAARAAADAMLVEILRRDGFQGPRYRRVLSGLMEYAWTTLRKWSNTDEIFHRSRAVGRPVRPSLIVPGWTADDRIQVVTDSVITGERIFREYGLLRGSWRPDGGAALTTYFVGASLRGFQPSYMRWRRDRPAADGHPDDGEALNAIPDQRAVDPCWSAVLQSEVREVLDLLEQVDPQLREGILLRVAGYSQREAAARVGLTEKALESRVGRLRVKAQLRQTTLESAEGGQ